MTVAPVSPRCGRNARAGLYVPTVECDCRIAHDQRARVPGVLWSGIRAWPGREQ
ncbi:hypothetical protein Ga0080559_TMP1588 [Salipiger profundus]|uniref:Uncharacterized protein n=1 Tax=Salipiger profundus TaxID=1229727 RepID=A0A1U7D2I9_9RHOB|nr:hypothetical protein Ga0080559_TMP1588 [Salipiger profundus]